jgi:oligoendopeptidase F
MQQLRCPDRQGADTPGASRRADRSQIPERYRWDLSPVFPDTVAWNSAKLALKQELDSLDPFRGALGRGAAVLADCLDLVGRLAKEYARLSCYASMRSDEDTRDALLLGMEREIAQMGADLSARMAFLQPEVLAIGRETVEHWVRAEPRLGAYRHPLDDILRRKDHTGSEPEEAILANASLLADAPHSIFSLFTNADFPYPEVTLSDGKSVRLDQAAFSLHRAAPVREDRRKVFAAYFGKLGEFERTFGAQLAAEVKKNMFYARSRRYPSALAQALDGSNIPQAVYHGLIENVHAHRSTFHRYLRLRRRLLGVDELHYYDLYVPVVPEFDVSSTYEEACDQVLRAVEPLGGEYVAVARGALTGRWVDVCPGEGKRSGAYANGGVYDVHPYILLNYNGKYDDVSTIAHELGHAMHSVLTNATQPYATSDYSIFVAEVASTLNEALLMDSLMATLTDDRARLSLLGHELDGIRGTVFRQAHFAEFEWRIHETAERGGGLTGESLGALYEEITRFSYGHDEGICVVDPEIRHEWTQIPHFYYNFYVYQYATSYTASSALAEMILAGDRQARERYLALLRAGGSDYPIELLKAAGVDMTTSLPFELTMRRMNRIMDAIEEILVRREPAGPSPLST